MNSNLKKSYISIYYFQLSVHPEQDVYVVVMKGAPEQVIDRCDTIFINNETKPLTTKLRNTCDKACLELAGQGNKTIQ